MSSNNGTTSSILSIVGYAVGSYFGYPYLGAVIGGAVGNAIDPPKGPNLQGPRLDDLSVQTSTYGVPIPRIYGTLATFGNVFWLENDKLKEVARKKKSGGKGGGGSSVTTYSYFATFAVGLCRGPIDGVRRIWIGSKLIYDAGADDVEAIIASNRAAKNFKIYFGDDTQNPDPRMQADKGVGNTPAYRGLAYIVFYDYALADHGNSLMGAQVKAEVVKNASTDTIVLAHSKSVPYDRQQTNTSFLPKPYFISTEKVIFYSPNWDNSYPTNSSANVYEVSLNIRRTLPELELTIQSGDVPPNVLVDDNNFYQDVRFWFNPPSGSMSGSDGSLRKRGQYTVGVSQYGTNGGDGPRLFFKNGTFQQSIQIANLTCATVTSDGFVYYATKSAVKKLDDELNEIASISATLTSLEIGDSRMDVGDDYLWIVPNLKNTVGVRRLPLDLSSIDVFGTLPNWSIFDNRSADFAVSDGVLVRAGPNHDNSTLNVQIFNLKSFSADDNLTLASVVDSEISQSGLITTPDLDLSDLTDTVHGYRVTQVGAIRSAIEPLRSAWPFDVVQAGYQIECKRRGGSSVMTIPASKLDCRAIGTEQGPQLSISREMESQLPRRLQLKYLDMTREYDTGEQSAERINVESVSTTVADLPIVFTPDEAAQKAEILLYLYWMERRDITFKLPPEYLALEPSDIVTIVTDDASYILRIVGITYTHDGRLECRAKFHDAATYTSDATGDSGSSTGGTIGLDGSTYYELLDIPTVIEDQNIPSFVAVSAGSTDGWPGAIIFRSSDNGQMWEDLQAFEASGTFGYALNSISSMPPSFVDARSVLNVEMIYGELESISELSMLNGGNLFAYGADGRWEIISARTVTLNADSTYTLRDMLRGRYGTEWASGLHAAGDALVLLNDADNALIGADSAQIGLSRLYRGITAGRSIDTDADRSFTYRAVNLEPLSPVYTRGYFDATTGEWNIFWIRRTRIGGEWRDLVDASIGETSEQYEIDILNNVDAVVRTLTATSQTVKYTQSQQVADFGTVIPRVKGVIYQMSDIVGRGYGESFDIGLADADVYFAYVTLLMHFNGANNGTSFIDVTGKTVTRFGDAITSTAQIKFGSASGYFDGSGDYLTISHNTGLQITSASDFTIECWIHTLTNKAFACIATKRINQGAIEWILQNNNGALRLAVNDGSNSAIIVITGGTIPLNEFVHVAATKRGNIYTIWVNGVQVATQTASFTVNNQPTAGLWIARDPHQASPTRDFHGYIDDLRITKGIARYVTTFAPPTEEFKDY